jgi:Acyl-CoA thioesterase C-terminal domain/Acyl-CoA thioesterase N-terminal domain
MTSATTASFSHAMTLRRADEPAHPAGPVYAADLNPHWTIGPKIHGGIMVALCAKAAHEATRDGAGATSPLAVSANFLGAPDPGPVRLATVVRKRGRRISVVDVELIQADRTTVRAAVTVGLPGEQTEPLLLANPVVAVMAPDPPPNITPIGPGHPMAEINHLAAGCDIRPDMTSVWSHAAGRSPLTRSWVRPRGEPTDALFALTAGDISMPVTFAVGRTGWAPTVQLTAYLRGVPADGWLRVTCTTTQIGQTWFDADHTVVDSVGRVVVQTRQLAMVPPP